VTGDHNNNLDYLYSPTPGQVTASKQSTTSLYYGPTVQERAVKPPRIILAPIWILF